MFSFTLKETDKIIANLLKNKMSKPNIRLLLEKGESIAEFNFKNDAYKIIKGENGFYTMEKIRKAGYHEVDNFEEFDDIMIFINKHNYEKWYRNQKGRRPYIYTYEGPRDLQLNPERKLLLPEKLKELSNKPIIIT